jgi:hypothetical protein
VTEVPKFILAIIASVWLASACQADVVPSPAPPQIEVLISIPEQRLAVVYDGQLLARYPVSTSRFGAGDNFGSFKTPLGEMRVCNKVGGDLPLGTVIRHRTPTREVLPVNAPGRDPIVTRVIGLDGVEEENRNALARGIYIHGTPEEKTIGMPVSWGCIRMRSRDVIKLYDEVHVGTVVCILPKYLPHMRRYEPPKEQPPAEPQPASMIATAKPSPAPAKPEAKPAAELASRKANSPPPVETASRDASAPPPVAEQSVSDNESAWRLMKGSILMANLPGADSGKPAKTSATQ